MAGLLGRLDRPARGGEGLYLPYAADDLCCGTVSALFALLDLDDHRGDVICQNNSGNIAYTAVRGTRTVSDRQWEHPLVLGPRVSRRRAHPRFVILPCHHPLGQTA